MPFTSTITSCCLRFSGGTVSLHKEHKIVLFILNVKCLPFETFEQMENLVILQLSVLPVFLMGEGGWMR